MHPREITSSMNLVVNYLFPSLHSHLYCFCGLFNRDFSGRSQEVR